jgi:putative ABC transport system permease protein
VHLGLAFRLARRELRGGIKGFRIFILSLALGVGAVAGVGSLSSALVEGLLRDGRKLLGGDIELRLTHREASAAEQAYLQNADRVSRVVELRTMAAGSGEELRTLVELKGVDDAYPLFGRLTVQTGDEPEPLLAVRDGRPGALAEDTLMKRLGLRVGDDIVVGERAFQVRGVIDIEPDRGADAFVLGPRIIVKRGELAATGLLREGSLIRYRYRLALPAGSDIDIWTNDLKQAFPKAGWRIRDMRNGAPGLKRFVDRMRLFLTLVGLTALLVGGVGVANAVKSYLDGKIAVIATLKCLGAPSRLIFQVYLIQVMALSVVGIVAALIVGAAAPIALGGLLADYLPFEARPGIYWPPLVLAAAFGLLTALAFAMWPLARAREVPGRALFRDLAAPQGGRPKPVFILAGVITLALLAGLAIVSAEESRFAVWFVAGALGAFVLFTGAGLAIAAVARRLPSPRNTALRMAVANLHRPGAPTLSITLSFGLGLSVLVAVATLDGNLNRQITDKLPEQAPAFFFIDIPPDEAERFEKVAKSVDGVGEIEKVPSLRGRIVKIKGVDADLAKVAPEVAWVLRGDRALTYQARLPEGAEIVAGEWWPEDYAGSPLVSLGQQAAQGLGLEIGDSITVNVLGREIEARVSNLRRIDWTGLGINFVVVFAPGALEAAPHMFIATARAAREAEVALQTAVIDALPTVTAIRIRDALEAVNKILGNIAVAVRSTALVALFAGVLVLAGALAASHRRRVYDSVILKVLGATRARILAVHLTEYAVLGLVVATLAVLVGTLAAYLTVTEIMGARWLWLPATALSTGLIGIIVTLVLGLAGTWLALRRRPAPLLRNE